MSTSSSPRIQHPGLAQKIMSAAEAAALIPAGANIGMSGFTGAGYPKQVPQALAARIEPSMQQAGRSRSTCGQAPPPRPNWTARWPR